MFSSELSFAIGEAMLLQEFVERRINEIIIFWKIPEAPALMLRPQRLLKENLSAKECVRLDAFTPRSPLPSFT
jgi:hypothetical protein